MDRLAEQEYTPDVIVAISKSFAAQKNTPILPLDSGGYLLRTIIRAAIEFLDQLYQYNRVGKTTINELGREIFEENVPLLMSIGMHMRINVSSWQERGE